MHCKVGLVLLPRIGIASQWLTSLVEGHKEAWEKAGILHCDISENNIMYVVNQDDDDDEDNDIEGILIDWDLCKYKSDLSQKATQYGRSVSIHIPYIYRIAD